MRSRAARRRGPRFRFLILDCSRFRSRVGIPKNPASPGILANFVPSCRFYGGGSSLELLGQPAQLLSDIPVGTSGGSLAAVSAFGQPELSRGHGVLSSLLVALSAQTTRLSVLRSRSG